MFKSPLKDFKIVPGLGTVAAGQTDQTTIAVDTTGYEGCIFLAYMGAITGGAATSLQAAQCATSGGSYNDLAGSSVVIADTDDNKVAALDIYRPSKPFLKATVKRATQNSVINGVIAILYNTRKYPVAQDTTNYVVSTSKVLGSPAEGTP